MENNLYLVHNISSSNFIETINKFNGLICPSLAIIKDDNFFNKFGGLTLLIDPSFIFDNNIKIPKSNNKNFVYNGDSYSSTFPEIKNTIDKKTRDQFLSENDENLKLCGDYFSDFEFSIKSGASQEYILNYLKKLNGLKYQFLIEQEVIEKDKFKIPYKTEKKKKTPFSLSRKLKHYFLKNEIKSIEDIDIEKLKKIFRDDALKFDDFFKLTNNNFLNKRITEKKDNFKKDIDLFLSSDNNDLLSTDFGITIFSYFNDLNRPSVKEIDTRKLSEILDKKILSSKKITAYKNRLEFIIDTMTKKQYFIFNEKKYDFNEENILKYFKKSGTQHSEETFTYSVNKAKSKNLSRLYSISDIEYQSKKIDSNFSSKDSLNEFNEFKNKILCFLKPNSDVFDFNDTLSKVVVNIHKSSNPNKYLRENLSEYIDLDEIEFPIDELLSISKKINNDKVEYFEVKNIEKLNTSSILKVLVPKDLNKEVVNFLKENNIPYVNYSDEEGYLNQLRKNKKWSLNYFYKKNQKKHPFSIKK